MPLIGAVQIKTIGLCERHLGFCGIVTDSLTYPVTSNAGQPSQEGQLSPEKHQLLTFSQERIPECVICLVASFPFISCFNQSRVTKYYVTINWWFTQQKFIRNNSGGWYCRSRKTHSSWLIWLPFCYVLIWSVLKS